MKKTKLPNSFKCPICENPIDLVRQIYEWDMYYGEDASYGVKDTGGSVFINIFCDKCDKPRLSVYIELGGMEIPDDIQAKIAKDVEEIKKEKN